MQSAADAFFEIYNPIFGVFVKFFGSICGVSPAILDVFAYKPVDKNVDFEFEIVALGYRFVVVAYFEKFIAYNARKFFCRKQ